MRVINRPILVHSCRIEPNGSLRENVVSGDSYVGELGIKLEQQVWYYPLPKTCRCKRRISVSEATEYEQDGRAVWILKFIRRKGEVILNPDQTFNAVWMPIVRERVPRVDLITRADIERGYIGSEKRSKHWIFNQTLKKFVRVGTIPEGMTKQEWIKDGFEEEAFERKIRRQYEQYINECGKLLIEGRRKILTTYWPEPFDPFRGQPIFVFGPDNRTGH